MDPLMTEVTKTWVAGKLKFTLTRKSEVDAQGRPTTQDTVSIINMNGATRPPGGPGSMWAGTYEEFGDMSHALGILARSVATDMFGPPIEADAPTKTETDSTFP